MKGAEKGLGQGLDHTARALESIQKTKGASTG